MKKSRKIFSAIAVIFMLCFTAGISAQEVNVNPEELSQAQSAIEYFGELTEGYTIDNSFNLEGYDLNSAYKAYWVRGLIIEEYKESGKFRDLLSEDFRICVPGTYNTITLVPNDDGVLEVAGTALIGDGYTELDWYEETDKIKEQINEEIDEIVFAESAVYHLQMIYVNTNENEYIVPYFMGLRGEIDEEISTRLTNGKLYTAEEFVEGMDKIYDLENNDPEACGGVPYKLLETQSTEISSSETTETSVQTESAPKESNAFIYIAIIISAAFVVLAVVEIAVYRKMKKRYK